MLRLLAENAGETVARETLAGSGVAANERTVDVQVNRLRRKIERDPANPLLFANRAGRGLPLADRPLKQLERGRALSLSLPVSFEQPRSWWRAFGASRLAPAQGPLCAGAADRHRADGDPAMRAHLCVHGAALAARSPRGFPTALTQEIAAIVDLHRSYPGRTNDDILARIAQQRLNIDMEFLPKGALPPALPKPFFSIVDAALSNEIKRQIGKPFWLDTVGSFEFHRDQNCARRCRSCELSPCATRPMPRIPISFLLWMIGTSFVLIVVAIALPRQSDQADPLARRRRRGVRQGPRS